MKKRNKMIRIPKYLSAVAGAIVIIASGGCSNSHPAQSSGIAPSSFISPGAPATMPEAPVTALPQPVAKAGGSGSSGQASIAAARTLTALGSGPKLVAAHSSVQPGQVLSVAALLGSVNGKPLFVHDILGPIAGQLKREAAQSRTRSFFIQQAARTVSNELQVKIDNLLMLQSAKHQLSKDDLKRA